MNRGCFRKKVLPVLIGIILGALILPVMYISDKIGIYTYFAVSVYVAVFALLFFVILSVRHSQMKRFSEKMNMINKNLRETMDVNAFTAQASELADKTRNKSLKSIVLLNLSTGYAYQGDYRKAAVVLGSINIKSFPDIEYTALYYNNMIEYMLSEGHIEEAENAYNEGKKYIDKLIEYDSEYMASVYTTLAHMEFVRGNMAKSEELFIKARMSAYVTLPAYQYIDLHLAIIYANTGRMEQAAAITDYIGYQKMYPSIQNMYDSLKLYFNSHSYDNSAMV